MSEVISKLNELRRNTFTNVGELVDYLSTLPRNTRITTFSSDLGGYSTSEQDHILVEYDERDELVEVKHCEFQLWGIKEAVTTDEELEELIKFKKEISFS